MKFLGQTKKQKEECAHLIQEQIMLDEPSPQRKQNERNKVV